MRSSTWWFGTAIRHDHGKRRATHKPTGVHADSPVLTELSVADYAKLVAAWSWVFFVGASYSTQMMSGVGGMGFTQNRDCPNFAQGVYSARERWSA